MYRYEIYINKQFKFTFQQWKYKKGEESKKEGGREGGINCLPGECLDEKRFVENFYSWNCICKFTPFILVLDEKNETLENVNI